MKSCFMHGEHLNLMKMQTQWMPMYRGDDRLLPCIIMVKHKHWKCIKTFCPHNCVWYYSQLIPGVGSGNSTAKRIIPEEKLDRQ